MEQNFFIKQNSTLPVLRIAPIDDGRYGFGKNYILSNAMKNASVYFSMKDNETGNLVISKARANIKLSNEAGCNSFPILEYEWKERDVKRKGTYSAFFNIIFNDKIKEEGYDYPEGNLIVPIVDKLIINII